MNDRFKCRIWDKNQNKMLFPASNYNFCNINGVIVQVEIYENIVGNICAHIRKNQIYENAEFMQCTGLKDKNGKLIYEGDVVKNGLHNNLVEWFKGGFWLNGFINGAKWNIHQCHQILEVIGNIYENPELLQECE